MHACVWFCIVLLSTHFLHFLFVDCVATLLSQVSYERVRGLTADEEKRLNEYRRNLQAAVEQLYENRPLWSKSSFFKFFRLL